MPCAGYVRKYLVPDFGKRTLDSLKPVDFERLINPAMLIASPKMVAALGKALLLYAARLARPTHKHPSNITDPATVRLPGQ